MQSKLLEIGFSDVEAKIYLELLAVGPQVVSVIARRLGINRSALYSYLRGLESKGLIFSNIRNGVNFFTANDPNCLVGYVDRQCQTFNYYRDQVLRLVPKFRAMMQNDVFRKPEVGYFEGLEGVTHVIYDALHCKEYFYSYLSLDKWLGLNLQRFLIDYQDVNSRAAKIGMKLIVPDLTEVKAFFSGFANENIDVLYVSKNKYPEIFCDEMNIYDDRVAILHLERTDYHGVLIRSREIALMHKQIFEKAWRGFKSEEGA